MTKKKIPDMPLEKPVIYVHGKGRSPVSNAQIKSLSELGLPVLSRLKVNRAGRTKNGYDQPFALLSELSKKFPGRPVIFLRAGMQPSARLLEQLSILLQRAKGPIAFSLLSNAMTLVNPFAGVEKPVNKFDYKLEDLVSLLAPGQLHDLAEWVDHFVLISADAVELMAGKAEQRSLMQQLTAVGGKLQVPDYLFIEDPGKAAFEKLKLLPHESLYPPPFGELSSRIQAWVNAGISELPDTDQPPTLHITHSWGGGVAHWIRSFIETDQDHSHFQLRSEIAQSNQAYGQKLSLYAGNELRCPVASWWLQPPIESVTASNESYKRILSEVCDRFQIARVIVSSLIGHDLCVLETGLPTMQILHDHFPLWPMLEADPEPYISAKTGINLRKAYKEHRKSHLFRDKDASAWTRLNKTYLNALKRSNVKIVAPGQWVLDLQNRLKPGFEKLETTIIPHGILDAGKPQLIPPRPRSDERLRLVILGRMQEGKGRDLLMQALPGLVKYAQVYLLGTGKAGEEFFGVSGVDVVLEYEQDELTVLLTEIGPHFAALLSIVPETFSYTLSELQRLGIPAIATRIGSFPDRISHGESGWLVDLDAVSVVDQVVALCRNHDEINAVRKNLLASTSNSIVDMVSAYNKFCPPAETVQTFIPGGFDLYQTQWAAAEYQQTLADNALNAANAKKKKLTQWAMEERESAHDWEKEAKRITGEFDLKAAWALQLSQDLEQERRQREVWVDQLETEIATYKRKLNDKASELLSKQYEIQGKEAELHNTRSELRQSESDLHAKLDELEQTQAGLLETQLYVEDLSNQLERLEMHHQVVLQSISWKVTRPFRGLRRAAGTFMQARAWNPMRWPWLFASLLRNFHTLGFKGTLQRIQKNQSDETPDSTPGVAQSFDLEGATNLQPEIETPVAVENDAFTLVEDSSDLGARGGSEPGTATEIETDAEPEPVEEPEIPGAFTHFEHPHVSIVIPVYNKWAYTAACLTSLLSVKNSSSFEVIVVDDQSSDVSQERLQSIDGLVYLRNEQNLGFVGSCNRGAQQARGDYLVLLNNDTQVTDGWLDELIDTFGMEPGIGMVGSRLIYPSGKQQESGGIIFNDASGWNYGREDDAERPEYHFVREVDYCSGACIILKTGYFHDLGGLDERYAPAYYEDTDLAFKVRESGKKVMIQPWSVIIHHEGVTSGTDTSSGTKRYQLINQEKFLDRWQSELKSQPEPVRDTGDRLAIRRASEHRIKGRILIIDATTPEPDQDSGSVRLTNLMNIFRELGYGVTFFADNRAYAGKYSRNLQKAGVEVLYKPWIESFTDYFRTNGGQFDYIFISRHYIATNYVLLLKRYCPQAKFIFDTVDLHYLRERRLAELEKSRTLKIAANQTRRTELSVIKAADATLVVSPVEKEVLAKDSPNSLVHVLSNIHPVAGRSKEFAERKDIYFIGGYQHPPNIDAACWFVNDVWPLIHAKLPDMQFHLVGSKAPQKIRSLKGDGVVFHGYVESLEPFLSDCRIAIAPLRYGAGVKGKVNMSMAHGQPMVVTPAAAEGLFAEHEKDLLLAADAETFADEVVRLYQDEELWYRLSDASIKNVEQHFSIQAARESVQSLLEKLSP